MKHQTAKAIVDPSRAALAEAIKQANKATADEQKARARVERAETLVAEASAAYDEASKALVEAREGQAERLAADLDFGAPIKTGSEVREARARESDAQDDLTAARSALEKTRAALEACEESARKASKRLELAIDLVITGELHRLLAEAEAMQGELGQRRSVIHEIESRLVSVFRDPRRILGCDDERLRRDEELIKRVEGYMCRVPFPLDAARASAALEWRRAAEALLTDASAPLPSR